MCDKKTLFSQLYELVYDEVNFGNKSKVLIMDKSNVKIYSKDSIDVTIVDVFFVPNLFWNLLSIRQLTGKKNRSLIFLMELAPLVIKIRRCLQKCR